DSLVSAARGRTGKRRPVVDARPHLVDSGAAPDGVVLLTFARRAAHEMLSRAERLVGGNCSRVHGGTFHSVGNRFLRQHGTAAGLPRDFSILDQGDAEDLMQLSRASLGFAKQEKRFPKKETLHYIYSRHVNTEQSIEGILEREFTGYLDYTAEITRIFADYVSRKGERNLVDY